MKKIIKTENAYDEEWRMILHYSYPENIKRYLREKGLNEANEDLIETISNSILQAKEYFDVSINASLQTSPVLLYYGMVNLLNGVYGLLTGEIPQISNHGLRIKKEMKIERIADVTIIPCSPQEGSLSIFNKIFGNQENICDKGDWTLLELMQSIPEIYDEIIELYKIFPKVVPVMTVETEEFLIERIENNKAVEFLSGQNLSDIIVNYNDMYINEQLVSNRIILYRKIDYKDKKIRTYLGEKFLKIFYDKKDCKFTNTTEIFSFMIMYALGNVCRYYPKIWNKFLRNDITGEKQIIEKLQSSIRRFFPNLMLDRLLKNEIFFINQLAPDVDIATNIKEEAIRKIIKEELKNGGNIWG